MQHAQCKLPNAHVEGLTVWLVHSLVLRHWCAGEVVAHTIFLENKCRFLLSITIAGLQTVSAPIPAYSLPQSQPTQPLDLLE